MHKNGHRDYKHATQQLQQRWKGLTAADLTRFSWQVLRVCSVSLRPFCNRVSAAGVKAALILSNCTAKNELAATNNSNNDFKD